MDITHTNRRHLKLIGWTVFCLVIGFLAATILGPLPAPDAQTSPVLPTAPGSFSQLAKKASPSVVNISAVKVIKGRGPTPFPFGPNDPFKDFFERFFRDQTPKNFRQRSLGTGFIIDKDGFILTNNHVVDKTDEIKVKLADEREFSAKIIGRDRKTDLALIRIEPDDQLIPLPLGDSDKLEVGDWVVAIGNPFGLGNTVTAGIVSAKYRQIGAGPYDNFIQTDASINPGNSGGPLLNTAGEVIGINSAIFSRSGGNIGIGFAIPINMAKELLPQLKKGKVIRGWLGVMIQKVTPELKDKFKLKDEKGALVADVTAGGPAEKAGIKRGDVIISFDGKRIHEMNDLPFIVGATTIGKTVMVDVIRNGRKKPLKVKIGELKEEKESQEVAKAKPPLGMTVEEITPQLAGSLGLSQTSGLVVVQVERNSPAEEAGLKQGDIILEVDQVPAKDLEQFLKKIREYKEGNTVLFLIKRGSKTLYLTLKVRG
ncbi:MAG: DegQ family serine endoprotease [Deltaproteobacteria bacterium]|nr:DegQ family serine endoprotease [Deltaproteobacteria bacterium]MBW1738951.1 DegQ family serine endoprotease [Deltaproteobacteria bacterium]MBW2033751.1 DegQ family serine endoprotease [Deltaproteobacteria bacterium]MBW2115651.1 DegQ family serine endoprotease [Deltaproteobacteria bacterium]